MARAATVRAAIASGWLTYPSAHPHSPDDADRLGALTLRPHQLDAVARLRAAIAEFGGALLADEVGLGKTYVALALARDARHPAIVAPAALRDMWRHALAAAGLRASFLSIESLSHPRTRRGGAELRAAPDFVVVDEAHHARTPGTRRYRALASLAAHARLLLLSATPIHNRRADLTALLALFLGARARSLDDAALARLVVRRGHAALAGPLLASPPRSADRLPLVASPVWVPLPPHDALLDALLALPPPLPPSDGGDGGALLVRSLVRQWASSDAALANALRRRLARGAALAASLERGRYPTRGELAAWTTDGESVQLAFAELLAPSPSDSAPFPRRDRPLHAESLHAESLLAAIRDHETAARALLARLRASDARDDSRAALLADLCARHPGEKVVAFAAYAETVNALFRRLRGRLRVAALTARGATVAGGPLTRRDALARFAPRGSGAPPPAIAERVDLLLATDLLSEGVNLQDASVVVHLDLPWTPARLEQRVGRVARLGSPHARVAVYALAPPASAEALLGVERRLREKLRLAGDAVGPASDVLPALATLLDEPGAARPTEVGAPVHAEHTRRLLARWLAASHARPARGEPRSSGSSGSHGGEQPRRAPPVVAALRSPIPGFLALCVPADPVARAIVPCLLGALDGGPPSAAPALVRRAVELADAAPEAPLDPAAADRAAQAVERWIAARRVAAVAGLGDVGVARARRRIVERIAAVVRRAPHHRRALVAPLAREARRAALAPCGAGAEWTLDRLARAELGDEPWLRAVAALGATNPAPQRNDTCRPDAPYDAPSDLCLAALLVLDPGD
ncbi:MAG: helicase-related protein [Gemmatimonadaceae bacterium]